MRSLAYDITADSHEGESVRTATSEPTEAPRAASQIVKPALIGGTVRLAVAEQVPGGAAALERQAPPARDVSPVPRITVQAFCDTPGAASTIEKAALDRLMSRAQVDVRKGGLAAAVELYRQAPTPNLIVVESRAEPAALTTELDRLAEVCDARTKVLVIGYSNDIDLYREILKRGVSEYVLGPVDAGSVIAAISSIYRGAAAERLGQVYAFVGAKGGVGSSTIAQNIAWEITQAAGSDVILADMDLPFGTAALNFDLDPGQGIAEAIQDAGRLDETLLERLLARYQDHLSLLAAPVRLERSYDIDESAFAPMLEVAQSSVPFMVLDVPHLWTSWAKRTLASADKIVITAAPDLANLRNAKSIVEFLKEARPNDAPPKLILNQVGVPKRPEIKPQDFAAALQIELIASIPFEPHLFGTAANNGQMIGQASAKATASRKLAEVAQHITDRSEPKRRNGIFGSGLLSNLLRKGPKPAAGSREPK